MHEATGIRDVEEKELKSLVSETEGDRGAEKCPALAKILQEQGRRGPHGDSDHSPGRTPPHPLLFF